MEERIMVNKSYLTKFIACLLTLVSMQVTAVSLNETIDGDIDSYDPFFLTEGNNSFDGTVDHNPLDFDRFAFVVPDGSTAQFSFLHDFGAFAIITGSYTWTLEQIDSPTSPYCSLFCDDPVLASQSYGSGSFFIVDSLYDFDSVPILSSGAYSIGVSGGSSGQTSSIMSYQANIVVSSVPVPAAVWLFGSGLIGLVGFARRKGI